MKIGRTYFSGSQAWPDHVLSYETGNLIVGVVLQIRGWAFGFELQGRHGNPWAGIYLGWWAFEVYFDLDRSFGEYD